MDRLDKLLSNTGRWSRKEVRLLVRAGRVSIDGVPARDSGEKCSPHAVFRVDGEVAGVAAMVYLMMNKPQGLVSSTRDPREKTVLELLPAELQKQALFPVGRLDKDAEGLLLLTNDGPLAHRLLAPRRHVKKVYYVEVEGELEEADIDAFQQGLILGDGTRCLPGKLEILNPSHRAYVTIQEGKYHQVKRMLAARGKPVRALKRIAMGSLTLDKALLPGHWRPLKRKELENLDVK